MRNFYVTEMVNEDKILREIRKDKKPAIIHYHSTEEISCNDRCVTHNVDEPDE